MLQIGLLPKNQWLPINTFVIIYNIVEKSKQIRSIQIYPVINLAGLIFLHSGNTKRKSDSDRNCITMNTKNTIRTFPNQGY